MKFVILHSFVFQFYKNLNRLIIPLQGLGVFPMKKIIYLLLILCSISQSFAQRYLGTQEEFGKNRIQYKRFEWKTIKSNNFEFNYYLSGDKYAQNAAKIAEGEYDRITELLGYTPFTAMKIFLYNSPNDLAQSNIGLTSTNELDGGILNLAKSRVQLAYTGNDSTYKKELVKQIARLFVYDMLYGGSLKEVLQSSLLLTVPEWYMSGMAAYIAEDNTDPQTIDKMKTVVLRNSNKKLSHLTGKEAEIVGEAIWNYIAVRYGKDNISNILNLTRIIRAEESSITSTLGISYNRFLKEFREFYANNAVTYNKDENVNKDAIITKPKEPELRPVEKVKLKDGEIDTDNYIFDAENINKVLVTDAPKGKNDKKNDSQGLPRVYSRRETLKIKGPIAYQNIIISNDTKTEFLMDPVRKLGLRATFVLNDLLENNIMKGGIFITPNLRNHDIFLQYDKTDKRVDYSFRFDRRSIDMSELLPDCGYLFTPLKLNLSAPALLNLARRLQMNRFMATVAYPISPNTRISFSPFLTTAVDYDVASIGKKDLRSTFLGYQMAAIFDNTTFIHGKTMVGTRARIQLDNFYGLSAADGFSRLNIDIRHYQPLLNTFIFATRISYGRSFGNSPKISVLGGAENWVNRTTNESKTDGAPIPTDLRGILFYDFPGSLRGFDVGRIYGTSHLLTNFELRLPLAQYFSKGSLSSNFLRNMQFVGFTDIGTAWFGNSGPFSRQNSLNTELIGGENNPFRATVTNFKNPFLVGYGLGARTTILGYFVKFDYAWGIEDKETSNAKFYFTLGYDF
jgi:hypothetical protein